MPRENMENPQGEDVEAEEAQMKEDAKLREKMEKLNNPDLTLEERMKLDEKEARGEE